jgi:hypothetical protein
MGVFEGKANVFTVYRVELSFEDRIMGGIPRDPKVIEGWLKSKAGITDKRELAQVVGRTMAENGNEHSALDEIVKSFQDMDADEVYNLIDKASEGMASQQHLNGFKRDEHGLYIEDRQVKAMLKESTNILFAGERWGKTKKGPRSFVAERIYVRPGRIHLNTNEPDGIELVVGHVSDKMGKRSTLTYHEYVERPVISFDLEVLRDEITLEQWAELWTHAERNGLGALRSQSYGRFDVTGWERVN